MDVSGYLINPDDVNWSSVLQLCTPREREIVKAMVAYDYHRSEQLTSLCDELMQAIEGQPQTPRVAGVLYRIQDVLEQ